MLYLAERKSIHNCLKVSAFQKKAGQEVDPQRVEKTFLLKDKEVQNRFTELMIDVPMAHILVSEKIINYAKIKLGRPL